MKNILFLMLLIVSPIVFAGDNHRKGGSKEIPVASYVEVDAEFITVPLHIDSNAKNPAQRYRLISNLERLIADKAKAQPNITLSHIPPIMPRGGSRSDDPVTASPLSTIYVSASIGSSGDAFEAAGILYDFIYGVTIPSNTELKYGNLFLSIANPEQFRKSIEAKVRTEISKTLESLNGDYQVKIYGLNSPVKMINRGGNKLAMFIPYKISYKQSK